MEVDDLLLIADGVGSLFDEIVVVKFEMSVGTRSRLLRPGRSRGFELVKSEMDSEAIVMNPPLLAGNEGAENAPKPTETVAFETSELVK